jgi:hypothetical protein
MPRNRKPRSEEPAPEEKAAVGNVSADLIAEALATMLDFDSQIASLAGRKGAAIARYCEQGIDRELLSALNKIGRKDADEARAYIEGLTRYAIAAEVVPPLADDRWTLNVRQAAMDWAPASGEASEGLREQRARRFGFTAGKRGHSFSSNPYSASPGSVEFVAWRDGHEEGYPIWQSKHPGEAEASDERERVEPDDDREAA